MDMYRALRDILEFVKANAKKGAVFPRPNFGNCESGNILYIKAAAHALEKELDRDNVSLDIENEDIYKGT